MGSAADLIAGLQGLPRMALKFLFGNRERLKTPTDETERIEFLENVEFYAVLEAGGLGLLSGLLLVLVTVSVEALQGSFSSDEKIDHLLGLMMAVCLGVVITITELVTMYYLALRQARQIAHINQQSIDEDSIDQEVMVALVNAGLQTPNLKDDFYGINPRQDLPRWKVLLVALFFKSKVSISRSVIKMMWKRFALRVLGRSISRGVLELASLPVFVFWNSWVMRKTVTELRYRSELPRRERDALEFVLGQQENQHHELVMQTLAEHIYIVGDVHPNIARLYTAIAKDVPTVVTSHHLNRLRDQAALATLSMAEVHTVFRTLTLVMAIDPRRKRAHREFLRLLHDRLGTLPPWDVKSVQQSILKGHEFPRLVGA